MKYKINNIFLDILFYTTLIICMIFFIDINLSIYVEENINKYIYKIFNFITLFGSFKYIFIINISVIACLILMIKFNKNKIQYKEKLNYMIYGICGEILSLFTTQFLKYFFGRSRPFNFFIMDSEKMFTFFNFKHEYVSFPSGHSSGIWALITCLLIVFKDNKYFKLLIFAGILISISRIILNMHYLSDVFFGAILSIYITKYTMKYLIKRNIIE